MSAETLGAIKLDSEGGESLIMGVKLNTIIESLQENKYFVEVEHDDEKIKAVVVSDYDFLINNLNHTFTVEMDYEEVLSWKILNQFNDEDSIIKQDNQKDDTYIIRGQVHSIVPLDNDSVIDVYILKGPEFIAVSSSELGDYQASLGDGIELIIKGLCFYPIEY